jgi:hypothetical protein
VLLPAGEFDVLELTSDQVASGALSICTDPLTAADKEFIRNGLLPQRFQRVLLKNQSTVTEVSGDCRCTPVLPPVKQGVEPLTNEQTAIST